MKRAFTLVELLVVIIILSVLATLGFQQYIRVVEKSRSSEAKMSLGVARDIGVSWWIERKSLAGFNDAVVGIGTDADQLPSVCRPTNYFSYSARAPDPSLMWLTATRCTAGGKPPQGSTPGTVELFVDIAMKRDSWTYSPEYR